MSPETWHAIYVACAIGIGWTGHMAFRMAMDYHDRKKDHEIKRLKWENDQLRSAASASAEEAPLPISDAPDHELPAVPPARKRRSPEKAQIRPTQAVRLDAGKVPPSIPRADLGRMQAQLNAFGKTRMTFSGKSGVWM